ncbi:unnamed protein product [Darwinula stevensoni]|uniref:J domain-containing protein n=1 Tax=Darwinula stevensoni TaxID=69355 RepID=A0A7R9FN48_9CRUS|nr:unnamed protein product [Darwinula stevensoni]CAG0896400.1 unnamed protein product [Darwinula stevensoni]
MTMGSSEELRKQGNRLYFSVETPPESEADRARLEDAIKLYNRALSAARGLQDYLSALKNLGMAHLKISAYPSLSSKMVIYHLEQSAFPFAKALDATEGQPASAWVADLKSRVQEATTSSLGTIRDLEDYRDKETALLRLCEVVHRGQKSIVFFEMGNLYYGVGVVARDARDFKKCLSAFEDCRFPYAEALRYLPHAFSNDDKLNSEIEEQMMTLDVNLSIAQAMQAIYIGEELQKKAVYDEETTDVELLWDSADWFTKAILCSRDRDLENEAIASSKLGLIFIQLLNLKEKGYKLLEYALQLTEALKPRSFVTQPWHQECVKAMSDYQQKRQAEEDAKLAKERAPYIEKLKDLLQVVKEAADDSPYKLLRHVYSKHPPKKGKLKDPLDASTLKKRLKKALVHYHPDKNTVTEHGMEWFVLCEEIYKYLSVKYTIQKA